MSNEKIVMLKALKPLTGASKWLQVWLSMPEQLTLTDGWVQEHVLEQTRNREQIELEATQWRKQSYENSKRKVDALREKSGDPTKWSAAKLHTMVAWFKQPGDSNIPKRKEQLMQWYLLTCNRSEVELRRKKYDEPAVTNSVKNNNMDNGARGIVEFEDPNPDTVIDNGEGGVAEALLQMLTKV